MKKRIMFSTILCANLVANVQGFSSEIRFSGELVASTCNVNINSQATNASGSVPIANLAEVGATAVATDFSINLIHCAEILPTAAAFFEAGESVLDSDGRLSNTGGTATGISLQIRDGVSSAIIKPNRTKQMNDSSYLPVGKELPYKLEYFAGESATAGTVFSLVTYAIQYQ